MATDPLVMGTGGWARQAGAVLSPREGVVSITWEKKV